MKKKKIKKNLLIKLSVVFVEKFESAAVVVVDFYKSSIEEREVPLFIL